MRPKDLRELEALKTVRPLGADYSLKLLDQDARSRIGMVCILDPDRAHRSAGHPLTRSAIIGQRQLC